VVIIKPIITREIIDMEKPTQKASKLAGKKRAIPNYVA
jgi:hypothetical protein